MATRGCPQLSVVVGVVVDVDGDGDVEVDGHG